MTQGTFRRTFVRELAIFVGLLFVGIIVVPIAIYWIGPQVLGEFGGYGFTDFFGNLSMRIRGGDPGAWFFILSPYLAVQALRLTWLGWRARV